MGSSRKRLIQVVFQAKFAEGHRSLAEPLVVTKRLVSDIVSGLETFF